MSNSGPSWPPPDIRPFLGNELTVPAKNRVGCDQCGYRSQESPAESCTATRQASAIGLAQPEPRWAELRLENPVLLTQVVDDVRLLALQPAQKNGYHQLRGNHDESLRDGAIGYSDTTRHGPSRDGPNDWIDVVLKVALVFHIIILIGIVIWVMTASA
jgi:hypothetical protein